jgi:hypothetical protein
MLVSLTPVDDIFNEHPGAHEQRGVVLLQELDLTRTVPWISLN